MRSERRDGAGPAMVGEGHPVLPLPAGEGLHLIATLSEERYSQFYAVMIERQAQRQAAGLLMPPAAEPKERAGAGGRAGGRVARHRQAPAGRPAGKMAPGIPPKGVNPHSSSAQQILEMSC